MFGNLFNQKGADGQNQDQAVDLQNQQNGPWPPPGVPQGQPTDPGAYANQPPPGNYPQQPNQNPAGYVTEQTVTTLQTQGPVLTVGNTDIGLPGSAQVTVTSPPEIVSSTQTFQQPFPAPPPPQATNVVPPPTGDMTQQPQPGVTEGVPDQVPQPPQEGQQVPGEAGDPTVQTGAPDAPDLQKRSSMSAMSRFDPRTTQVFQHAQAEAKRIQQPFIEPDQLLFGLIYDGEIFKLLEQFSLDAAKLSRDIQAKEQQGTFAGDPTLSEQSSQIIDSAYTNTKNRGASFISPEDLLVSLFSSAVTADFLKTQGLEKQALETKLAKTGGYTTGRVTMLDKYGVDLTESARNGELDPVTGRDKETERLIHILLRRTKNNPIIIGEPGVGKTAIVEHLAQQIVDGNVPADLKDRKLIQLDITSLIAGASHRGEFEERLRGVIKEVQASNGQIVLFIDEIHTLIGAGDTDGAMDASNIIKPFLARGQLQVIGTTTISEYRKYFQKDKAFERRFQAIQADEPTEEVAIEMMNITKPRYEQFHNVVFLPEAVEGAVYLSKKYIGERFLPDKAVDLIDEAAAEVKLQVNAGKRQSNQVAKADIEKVVSNWTGIPITRLTEDESEKLLHLEDMIHKRFIDQEEAVATVSEAVRRGRIGLASANRPIASFIFLGPTGVGKTELAKTLAEIMFGRDDAMIRLDMSEYMEKHEVAKLIGAPPGYVGYEEGGQLTEAVRAKPYSIVLLDEVEKAHPDVFNILLQLLEDGRLTDNKGNTISFKNTIIIATSNLGSQLIQKHLLGKMSGKQEDKKEGEKEEGEAKEAQRPDTGQPQVQPPSSTGQPQSPHQQTQTPSNGEQSQTPDQQDQTAPGAESPQTSTGQQDQVQPPQRANLTLSSGANKVALAENIDYEELNKILLEELHKFFRPELLNRFDDLVVFKPLSQKDMSSIAKLGIEKTSKLLKEQGFSVQITEKALAVLALEGYDPIYGARPLRRLIQTAIENPIAMQIISKAYAPGDIILIDYDDTKAQYVFLKTSPKPPAPETQQDTPQESVNQPVDPNTPSLSQDLQQQPQTGASTAQLASVPDQSQPVQQGVQPPPPGVQNMSPSPLPPLQDQGVGAIMQPPVQPPPPQSPPPANGNGQTLTNGALSSSAIN